MDAQVYDTFVTGTAESSSLRVGHSLPIFSTLKTESDLYKAVVF